MHKKGYASGQIAGIVEKSIGEVEAIIEKKKDASPADITIIWQ